MTFRVEICIGSLGFEDFDQKYQFYMFLDFHNLSGELASETTSTTLQELATASYVSPWRV